VQIHGHWRIEAARNSFSRSTFCLKLGRKAARGLGLSGGAAAIYSHSLEGRDLFTPGHAVSLGKHTAHSIRSNGLYPSQKAGFSPRLRYQIFTKVGDGAFRRGSNPLHPNWPQQLICWGFFQMSLPAALDPSRSKPHTAVDCGEYAKLSVLLSKP